MRPKLMDWEGERLPKIDEIWMLACINNSLKNRWFWRPALKNIVKKALPKTMYFSHAFFSRFSSIWASKTTYFSMNFWCMLASKFHGFLGPFRLPNPLALGACSIPFNIEREKWDFRKICIFPRENHYFSGFEHRRDQQIQETIDETTQWKCIENPYDFNHQFYQKSIKIREKLRFPQAYPKKYQKCWFFDHFGIPKPSQNPSEIKKKSMKNRC